MELTIKGLTKQYKDVTAVDNMSVTLKCGVYGLLGANGAGKTTLMRMLCGVLKQTRGEIKYTSTKTYDVTDEGYRDKLGYLPQDFGYYPEFTAFDFLCYIGTLKGLPKAKSHKKAKELLELVSLSNVAKRKIKTFSGGMKQRLGIAQAMINNPKILILDEPTSGLDPKERVRFRNLISQLSTDRIVLLSTHIVSDIEHIANTILVMKDGKFIHGGSLEEIIKVIENKVWECVVSKSQADTLCSTYPIINVRHETLSSANMQSLQESVYIRLVAEQKPCDNAVVTPATLEDLYLYYFQEVEVDE